MTKRIPGFAIGVILILACTGCSDDPAVPEPPAPEFLPVDGAVLTADFDLELARSGGDSVVVEIDGMRLDVLEAAPFTRRFVLVDHDPGEHVIRALHHAGAAVDTFTSTVLMCHGIGHSVGNFAVSRSLPDRDGLVRQLNDPGPGRLVLLDFWASWCGPCVDALPETQAHFETYSRHGLTVLTVNAEPREDLEAFLAQNDYTFPVLLDASGYVTSAYGVWAIPTYYLIDHRGVVRYARVGSGNDAAMEAEIRRILGLDGPAGPAPAGAQEAGRR